MIPTHDQIRAEFLARECSYAHHAPLPKRKRDVRFAPGDRITSAWGDRYGTIIEKHHAPCKWRVHWDADAEPVTIDASRLFRISDSDLCF